MAKHSKACDSLTSSSLPPKYVEATEAFLVETGIYAPLSDNYNSKDSYSHLIRDLLKIDNIQRGRVSCVLSVLPAVTNMYNGLFGGAIGAISERLAIACVRTIIDEDKEVFLGELSMTYLSPAQQNEVVVVDGYTVRSGKNASVVAIEFRIKKSLKLVYTARVTIHHSPISKL